MKKTAFFFAATILALNLSAQSEKYLNAMKANVQGPDTIHTAAGWLKQQTPSSALQMQKRINGCLITTLRWAR
jgi:hypothetical protein